MIKPDGHAEMKEMVGYLLVIARNNQPEHFMAFFGGLVANVVGNLSDDYWRDCLNLNVCDEPGCNCHGVRGNVIEALDALRDDHKANVKYGKVKL